MATLLLIDGQNVQHRSLYGATALTRADGREVGAVIAFVATLNAIMRRYRPTVGAAVFDGPGRGFRRYLDPAYKGMREREEEDASRAWQVAAMRHAVRMTGMRVMRSGCLEADDVIATLAHASRVRTVVCSDDKDLQTLTSNPLVRIHQFRDLACVDATHVRTRWGGVDPRRIPDVQTLCGDGGDGVAGLRGVGRKTAVMHVEKNGSAERALLAADQWGGRHWMTHAAAACNARHMRDAVRAIDDAPVPHPPTPVARDWPLRLARVLAALGSAQQLGVHCGEHGISPRSVAPDDQLRMDDAHAAGVDALPRGLFA